MNPLLFTENDGVVGSVAIFARYAALMALLTAGMVLSGMSAATMMKAALCIEINDCSDCQIPGNPD